MKAGTDAPRVSPPDAPAPAPGSTGIQAMKEITEDSVRNLFKALKSPPDVYPWCIEAIEVVRHYPPNLPAAYIFGISELAYKYGLEYAPVGSNAAIPPSYPISKNGHGMDHLAFHLSGVANGYSEVVSRLTKLAVETRNLRVELDNQQANSPPPERAKPPAPPAKTETILPALLSASDIASRIQKNSKSVTSFLSRFAERNRDCRVENESKRKNEARYLYRTAVVWPAIQKWVNDEPKN